MDLRYPYQAFRVTFHSFAMSFSQHYPFINVLVIFVLPGIPTPSYISVCWDSIDCRLGGTGKDHFCWGNLICNSWL